MMEVRKEAAFREVVLDTTRWSLRSPRLSVRTTSRHGLGGGVVWKSAPSSARCPTSMVREVSNCRSTKKPGSYPPDCQTCSWLRHRTCLF